MVDYKQTTKQGDVPRLNVLLRSAEVRVKDFAKYDVGTLFR